MKKKFMPLLLVLALGLSGCHKMVEDEAELTLYASFYPIYALALGVTRDVPDLRLKLLTQPQDGCIRAYTLSQWDAALLEGADALIMGGRGLESFAGQLEGGGLPTIAVMDGLALEGDGTFADENSHFTGPNPWLFLDPAGAADMARAMAGALEALDPGCAAQYRRNLEAMQSRLDRLAGQMRLPGGGQVAVMQEGLTYLARAMNLTVCAQVDRESAASLSDNELAGALDTLRAGGARVVLIEAQAPSALVAALEGAGFWVAPIDILTAHTAGDGEIYFAAMAQNAQAVRDALAASSAS